MKGVRVDVHQSSSRSDNRKLLSITWSPSVAVVDEMAPRWITTSSLRPFSQSDRSDGGMRSASWRLPRLRHLPSDPSISLTTTSVCPASFRSATTFDPMNPAPPVTSNISARSSQPSYFCLSDSVATSPPRLSRAGVIVKSSWRHTRALEGYKFQYIQLLNFAWRAQRNTKPSGKLDKNASLT